MLNISFKNSILSWIIKKRMHQIELFMRYPHKVQEDVFSNLIAKGKYSKFGNDHHFAEIKSYQDFVYRVPVRSYEEIYSYVKLLRNGEKDILWPGQINWFAKSSGTTNSQSKFIPITKESLDECHYKAGKDMLSIYCNNFKESKIFEGKGLMLGGSQEKNNIYNFTDGDLSAILIDNFPFWVKMQRIPDRETALMDKWEDKLQLIYKQAVKENITSITGVPSWMLLLLKKIKEKEGLNHLKEIWPNLELYIHGGVNFSPYQKQFEDLIPSRDMNYLEVYNASEGFFGIQDQIKSKEMLLMLDYGVFYEFIPMDTFFTNKKTVMLVDVEEEKDYAVVISTNSGLWRYLIGDTVRFTCLNPYRIKIVGRTKSFINAFGEELVVGNAEEGLRRACEIHNATIDEYTVYPVFNQDGTAYHEWLIEFYKMPENIKEFQCNLDLELKKLNSDYKAKREGDLLLKLLNIKVMEKGTFYRWLAKNNRLGGQNKVIRLSNDDKIGKELLSIHPKFSTK